MDRSSKISIVAEADFNEDEDDSMQFNPVKHLKCQCSKWQPKMFNIHPVVESIMSNATIVAGMVIFIGNVHQHHGRPIEVEDRIVDVEQPEDEEEADEEDAEVVVEDHKCQLEPLWSRRDQKHLDMDRR